MLRRIVLAVAILAPILAAGPVRTVEAALDGGRITLIEPGRSLDTRTPGAPRVTQQPLGSGVLNVTIVDPAGPGTASVRTCGAPASASDARVPITPGATSTLRVVRSDAVCIYTDVPVHLVVDNFGFVTPTATSTGTHYVPAAQPVELFTSGVAPPPLSTTTVDLGRPLALPPDAVAAVVSLAAFSFGDGAGYAVVHACASGVPMTPDLYMPAVLPYVVSLPRLGPSDRLCLSVWGGPSGADVDVEVDLLGWLTPTGTDTDRLPPMYSLTDGLTPEPGLNAVNPDRALDTRNGIGCVVIAGDCSEPTAPVAANTRIQLDLNGYISPQTTAVSLNVTVTQTAAAGFLTVWPCDQPQPVTSNLNFAPGDTRANLVVAKLAVDGTICMNSTAATDLIADLTGTYEFGGGMLATSLTPDRLLDTRNAIGVPTTTMIPAGGIVTLQVSGRGGVPNGADAATFNVTAVNPSNGGYLTAWPCDQPLPDASNLNFAPGSTVPNLVTVKLSSTGTVCLFTSASAHLLADVGSWFGPSGTAGLVELSPGRLLDTRNGIGAPRQKLAANGVLVLQVSGREGVRSDATAVVMNVTVTGTTAAGFATVWPCDAGRPTVSNLNFRAGDTVPNLVSVKLSAAGTVCIFADATTDVLADVAGFFTNQPTPALVLTLQ
jgi:hypothetical protein